MYSFRAVRHNNISCGTRLCSKGNADTSWLQKQKFDCPEGAEPEDIVTWQTLTCLSKNHSYSIRMDGGTSPFR